MLEKYVPDFHDRLKTYLWIWNKLMDDRGRRHSKQLIVVVLLSAAALVAEPYGIATILKGLERQDADIVQNGLLIFLGFILLAQTLTYVRQYVREKIFNVNFWRIPMELTRLFYAQSLGSLIAEDSDIDGGGVESTRDKIWNITEQMLFTVIPAYAVALFVLLLTFYIHPTIGLCALTYFIVESVLTYRQNNILQHKMEPVARAFRRWDRRTRERWHEVATVKYNGVEQKTVSALTDEVIPTLRDDFEIWGRWFPRRLFWQKSIGGVLRTITYGYGAYLTLSEQIPFEFMVLLMFSLERMANDLYMMSHAQQVVQESMIRVRAYRNALTSAPSFDYRAGIPFTDERVSIAFSNVSLTHGGKDTHTNVLKDVSFSIDPGERVAIVGPSGAGKSQLVNLILRACDPTEGTVYVNKQDLRKYSLESFCAKIGHIPQSMEVFEGSIRENVSFGLPNNRAQEVGDPDVWNALKRAGLSFTNRLNSGLDTRVGYKGMRLSGGERQRLIIARAHIKEPVLLIADEATSALDSLSESHVLDELYKSLNCDTTVIMIAHRLSTLRSCDKIIFVKPLATCCLCEPQVTVYTSMQDLYQSEQLFREMADMQGFQP